MSNQYYQARSAVQSSLKNPVVMLANNHKIKMCNNILNGEICPFGSQCDFAHDESELRNKVCLFQQKGVCNSVNCQYDHSSSIIPSRNGWNPVQFVSIATDKFTEAKKRQICTKLRDIILQRYREYAAYVDPIMNDLFQMKLEKLEVFNYNPLHFEDAIKRITQGYQSVRTIAESPVPNEKIIINAEIKSPIRYTSPYSWANGSWGNDDEDDLADEIEANKELNDILARYTPSPAPISSIVALKDITPLADTLSVYKDRQGNFESELINGVQYNLFHIQDVDIDSDMSKKAVRGIICDQNGVVVCKSFSFTNEVMIGTTHFDAYVPSNLVNSIVIDSFEGTMVRLWHDNGSWTLSTHRKINAHKSRWNAKENIGTMFYQCLAKEKVLQDDFHSRLQTHKVYVFQLTNDKDNRMVCSDSVRSIYSLGAFDRSNNFSYEPIEKESGLVLPPQYTCNSVTDIINLVTNTDSNKKIGISLLCKSGFIIKIVNDNYKKASDVRGSATNINLRYLEVRNNKQKTNDLFALFPESKDELLKLEQRIRDFARSMYKLYKERFYTKDSQYPLFRTDSTTNCFNYVKCHKSHLKFIHDIYTMIKGETIKKPDFNLKHVWNCIDKIELNILYLMIKHFEN